MIMAEKFLDCCQGQGEDEDEDYKRMAAVLGEMRCQQIMSHLSRLRLYKNPLYNHAPDPFNSPLFRVH